MKKFAFGLALASLFNFAGIASAGSVSALYNTGAGPSGLVGNNVSPGPYWSLISFPAALGTGAYGNNGNALVAVTSAYGSPASNSYTIGDDSLSEWIGPTDGELYGPAGDYVYQTTFQSAVNGTLNLLGQWATDNSGVGIDVDGNSGGINTASGFTSWSNFTVQAAVHTGTNTLDFDVYNEAPSYGSPTALRVEFASATVTPVPLPTAAGVGFSLLGGFGALAALRKRYRRSRRIA